MAQMFFSFSFSLSSDTHLTTLSLLLALSHIHSYSELKPSESVFERCEGVLKYATFAHIQTKKVGAENFTV